MSDSLAAQEASEKPMSLRGEAPERKRVGKACDRCRMKKSKCDGDRPCGRCMLEDTPCVFGERKLSRERVFPKGYVEMLERERTQLIKGLRAFYQLGKEHKAWPTVEARFKGQPLVHDLLAAVDALKTTESVDPEPFEEELSTIREKAMVHERARSTSPLGTPPSTTRRTLGHRRRGSGYPKMPPRREHYPTQQFPPTPDYSPCEDHSLDRSLKEFGSYPLISFTANPVLPTPTSAPPYFTSQTTMAPHSIHPQSPFGVDSQMTLSPGQNMFPTSLDSPQIVSQSSQAFTWPLVEENLTFDPFGLGINYSAPDQSPLLT